MKTKLESDTGSNPPACSRFSADRIEELMQARDHIAEGDRDMVCKDEACDLVNWYADELDRVRTHYQTALYEISLTALKSGHYPENDQGQATRAAK